MQHEDTDTIQVSKKSIAFKALAEGKSIIEAANEAGVTRVTVYRWRKSMGMVKSNRKSNDKPYVRVPLPIVDLEHDRQDLQLRSDYMIHLGFDALQKVLSDPDISPALLVKAAKVAVEVSLLVKSDVVMDERVEALEDHAREQQSTKVVLAY